MKQKKPRFNFYNSTASLLEVMTPEICQDFMINLCAYMAEGKIRKFKTKEAEIYWRSQKMLYKRQRKAYEVYLRKGNQHSKGVTPKQKEKPLKAVKKDITPYFEIIEYYHNTCRNLPKVLKITDTRKRNIKNRLKEHGNDAMAKVFKNANESDFLNGNNDRGFKANIDFIIDKTKFVKILEGQYNNQPAKKLKNKSAIQEIINQRKNLC